MGGLSVNLSPYEAKVGLEVVDDPLAEAKHRIGKTEKEKVGLHGKMLVNLVSEIFCDNKAFAGHVGAAGAVEHHLAFVDEDAVACLHDAFLQSDGVLCPTLRAQTENEAFRTERHEQPGDEPQVVDEHDLTGNVGASEGAMGIFNSEVLHFRHIVHTIPKGYSVIYKFTITVHTYLVVGTRVAMPLQIMLRQGLLHMCSEKLLIEQQVVVIIRLANLLLNRIREYSTLQS